MRRETLEEIIEAHASRRALVLLTWLDGSRQDLMRPPDFDSAGMEGSGSEAGDLDPALRDAAAATLKSDRAELQHVDGVSIFVQPLNPPLRLVIVGAVHIGQYLAEMAASVGYDVTVVDPRSAFASSERFPSVRLVHEWPDAALSALALDARTAVVTLTHDPKLDDPALQAALASEAFYVGSLGSRRTQARRLERLRACGVADAALQRIRGPVGLDIGARSPSEIAVSILAEITGFLRGTH